MCRGLKDVRMSNLLIVLAKLLVNHSPQHTVRRDANNNGIMSMHLALPRVETSSAVSPRVRKTACELPGFDPAQEAAKHMQCMPRCVATMELLPRYSN